MDFPDSNHLAKTLTIVTGLDTVNLTYYNFFAPKENIVQVRISFNTDFYHHKHLGHANLNKLKHVYIWVKQESEKYLKSIEMNNNMLVVCLFNRVLQTWAYKF